MDWKYKDYVGFMDLKTVTMNSNKLTSFTDLLILNRHRYVHYKQAWDEKRNNLAWLTLQPWKRTQYVPSNTELLEDYTELSLYI
jgi:hypothetical protein